MDFLEDYFGWLECEEAICEWCDCYLSCCECDQSYWDEEDPYDW